MSNRANLPQSQPPISIAYYPDYIPGNVELEMQIAKDFQRMQRDGLSVIRMGEFSWARVEPQPGKLDFSCFDIALRLALQYKLSVIFCTPTACPPKWLTDQLPEILPVTATGTKVHFGSQRHYDPTSPAYQQESRRITQAYAAQFGSHPAVTMCQVDNEFGHHGSAWLYSRSAEQGFQKWLKAQYDDNIEQLNQSWHTGFWAQGYSYFYDWLLLWAAQAAALGARGICYFSWQRFYGGAEQYHDGIVGHDVRVNPTKQERVIGAIGETVQSLEAELGYLPPAPVRGDLLIIHSTESLWSHDICSQTSLYQPQKQIDQWCQFASVMGMGVEFAPRIKSDLSQYKLLILPGYAFVLSSAERWTLFQYLRQGGKVLSLPRTCMKERNNQMSPLPISFYSDRELCLPDFGALGETETETFTADNDTVFKGFLWAEDIEIMSDKWKAIAKYRNGIYKGRPAILQRVEGDGRHIHCATVPECSISFYRWIATALGLSSEMKSSSIDVQIIPFEDGYFALNFGREWAEVIHNYFFKNTETFTLGTDFTLKIEKRLPTNQEFNTLAVPPRSFTVFRKK